MCKTLREINKKSQAWQGPGPMGRGAVDGDKLGSGRVREVAGSGQVTGRRVVAITLHP